MKSRQACGKVSAKTLPSRIALTFRWKTHNVDTSIYPAYTTWHITHVSSHSDLLRTKTVFLSKKYTFICSRSYLQCFCQSKYRNMDCLMRHYNCSYSQNGSLCSHRTTSPPVTWPLTLSKTLFWPLTETLFWAHSGQDTVLTPGETLFWPLTLGKTLWSHFSWNLCKTGSSQGIGRG